MGEELEERRHGITEEEADAQDGAPQDDQCPTGPGAKADVRCHPASPMTHRDTAQAGSHEVHDPVVNGHASHRQGAIKEERIISLDGGDDGIA
jgi:hypothetical protein